MGLEAWQHLASQAATLVARTTGVLGKEAPQPPVPMLVLVTSVERVGVSPGVYMSVCPCLVFVSRSVCVHVSVCPCVYLCTCPHLWFRVSAFTCLCLSVYMSVCVYVCPDV